MIRHTFILLLLFFAVSNAAGAPVDSITVAGRIVNIADGQAKTIIVNECDYSSLRVREITKVDSAGYFKVRIPFSYPHTFTLNYDVRNFINAFAAPGDSIFLEIDASRKPVEVCFSGDKASVSQELNEAMMELTSINSCLLPPFNSDADEFIGAFTGYVEAGRKAIDKYADRKGVSEEVKRMLYANNLYCLANHAMEYTGRDSIDARKFYLNPVFDIFNEENSKVMVFPYHLSKVLDYAPEVIEDAPKGIVRDLMYVSIFENSDEEVVPDKNDFYLPGYYDRLFGAVKDDAPLSVDGIDPGDILVYRNGEVASIKDVNPLEWLLKEYSGHPIYLDVSSTWCGPCIANLKNSEDLRNHYKESGIVFAAVWLRSSLEEWRKLAPKITNTVQIFISENEMSDMIMKQLSVGGFPSHYMILRDGSIKTDVPNYLSIELPVLLDSQLNP